MDKSPKISVVMGVYNEKREWLTKTIDSILGQSYPDFEFIIILDKPDNEELKKVIEDYKEKDHRVKLYINEKNLGLIKTLNRGISLAKGEFIARMDADDIAEKYRFEKQVAILDKDPKIALVGSRMIFIDEMDNVIGEEKHIPTSYEGIKIALKYHNIFCHPSLMYRTDVARNIGGYREVIYAEDYDFTTRIVGSGYKAMNIDEPLIRYRMRQTSISKSNESKLINSTLYVRELYNKRLKENKDNFSKEHLSTLMENENKPRIKSANNMYLKAKYNYYKQGKKVTCALLCFLCGLMTKKYAKVNLHRILFSINKNKIFS